MKQIDVRQVIIHYILKEEFREGRTYGVRVRHKHTTISEAIHSDVKRGYIEADGEYYFHHMVKTVKTFESPCYIEVN